MIPILPTTPFVIISIYFLKNGSVKFKQWLFSKKIYRKHITNYINNKSLKLKEKIKILFIATLLLIISFIIVKNSISKCVIILILIIKYYYFIVCIKTIK